MYYFTNDVNFWGKMAAHCMTEHEMEEACKMLSQESGWADYETLKSQFHPATIEELINFPILDEDDNPVKTIEELTGWQTGIVAQDGAYAVCNFRKCPAGHYPHLEHGEVEYIPMPQDMLDRIASGVEGEHIDDIRDMFTDAVRMGEDGNPETNMEIVYDRYDDIPAMFDIGRRAKIYHPMFMRWTKPYEGQVFDFGDFLILTVDLWN